MATFSAVAGTVFKYTVSSTLTEIPGVGSMSYSGGDKNDINVTAISDETEVFIPGRRTAKELSFPMYYDPADAGQAAMLAAYNASSQTPVVMNIVDDHRRRIKELIDTYPAKEPLPSGAIPKLSAQINARGSWNSYARCPT